MRKSIDETEPRSHVVTRFQRAPEVANGGLEGPGRDEEIISRLVVKFLIFVFVFGAFLGHGTAGRSVSGEVGGLVFTAAVVRDPATSAVHQVVVLIADAAFYGQGISVGHSGRNFLAVEITGFCLG